jgi:hypothetical protein
MSNFKFPGKNDFAEKIAKKILATSSHHHS